MKPSVAGPFMSPASTNDTQSRKEVNPLPT